MSIKSIITLIFNHFYLFVALVFAAFSGQGEIPFSQSQGVLAATKDEFSEKGPFEAFVVLNDGLLPSLRFYGLDDSPIGKLLIELFPSPDGSLFTAQARNSHPAYNMVSDPKIFANTFEFLQGKMKEDVLAKKMLAILDNKLTANKTKETNVKQYNTQLDTQKTAIQNFLNILKAARDAQVKTKYKIYPSNIVEIALFAYFIKTYNAREDLNKLDFAFNKRFSDKDGVFSKDDYEKNKANIAEFFKSMDIEKLYLMAVGYEDYEQPFPRPIVYRGDVLYLGKDSFADCIETILRNLIYFWIMDPVAKEITEKRLIEITKKLDFDTSANKAHFDALMAHLKKHTSLLNSTSEKIHADFVDTVVGDLNNGKQAQSLNDVLYYKTTKKKNGKYYEIGSARNLPHLKGLTTPDLDTNTPVGEGIYNVLNVLAKLFPDKKLTAKWDDDLTKRAEQAKERLDRLSEIFSTDVRKFDWKPQSGQKLEDKFLTIEFYVNDKHTFSMEISPEHGQLMLVQNAKTDWRTKYNDAKTDFPNEVIASLYLRAPSEDAGKTFPISRLFNPQIKEVIGAIRSMRFLLKKTKIADDIKSKLMANWITKSIPKNDEYAQGKLGVFLYEHADDPATKDFLGGITSLGLKDNVDFKRLANFTKLKKLDLDKATISNIDGLNGLPGLESLHLGYMAQLKKLSFTEDMNNLKKLDLKSSTISEIDGLEHIPELELLVLSYMSQLRELTVTNDMNKLKSLDLQKSGISKIYGLEHLTALEELALFGADNLQELTFTKDMNNLKVLDLSGSDISKIYGIEHLTALEELDLERTLQLKELTFAKDMIKLKKLRLSFSGISKIYGIEHLTALEQLDLEGEMPLEFYFPLAKKEDKAIQTMINKFKLKQYSIVWVSDAHSFNTFLDDLVDQATAVGPEPKTADQMLRSLRGIFEKHSELASSEEVGQSFRSIRSIVTSYNFESSLEKNLDNLTKHLIKNDDNEIIKICKNKVHKLLYWESPISSLMKAATYICELAESRRFKE